MGKRQYFGTDGIRGTVGSTTVHPEFMLKLGWAVGKVLSNKQQKKVIIGKDTRISGYMIESALEAGLSSAGVDVALLGPMPTPAIAYLTQTLRASAGIVISASHNPYQDNGVKFFSAEGTKLPDDIELAIEAMLEQPFEVVNSNKLGRATRISDAPGRYIEFCKASIDTPIRLHGLKIVVDCANGATYHIAPNVFAELGAEVIAIGDKPDGYNINKNCGSTVPEHISRKVVEVGADVGVALDGDGDRLIMVDAKGNVIDGDQILYAIVTDRLRKNTLRGGVVGTLMTNIGFEKAMRDLNVPFLRAKVGDRYVMETLKAQAWILGGEPSGHIVCLDKTTTGDGIVSALQVLSSMVQEQKTLAELVAPCPVWPQTLINVSTKHAQSILENSQIRKAVSEVEADFKGHGRVLLRPSGTEPLLRVMVEGDDAKRVQSQAEALAQVVEALDKQCQDV